MHAEFATPGTAPDALSVRTRLGRAFRAWFDTARHDVDTGRAEPPSDRIDLWRTLPFVLLHLACLGALLTGASPVALAVAAGAFAVRMFAITAFYHRYFSHRAFKTSRAVQFAFAVLGASAVQRGPIWWAAHHRNHHAHSDREPDAHSPAQHGFWRAHMGWFLIGSGFAPDLRRVRDLTTLPGTALARSFRYAGAGGAGGRDVRLGVLLEHVAPQLGTDGWQMLVWGFFISTVACWHVTYMINSLAHVFGRQRYRTHDDSRNNWLLALLTLGEGWHNNHHYCPGSARQGFYWWEVDISYYVLRLMSWIGIMWDLKTVPLAVRDSVGTAPQAAERDAHRNHRLRYQWYGGRASPARASTTSPSSRAAITVGGHTATLDVEVSGREYAIDTGFIVFNDWTYPGFVALLDELGVASQDSNMSFSLRCERSGLEYNGTSLNSLFAQRRNLLRPSFLRMLARDPAFQQGIAALLAGTTAR